MNILLDDQDQREQLFPFTHTRHVGDIRIGILTIREKWERLTHATIYNSTRGKQSNALVISSNIIPTYDTYASIIQQFTEGSTPGDLVNIHVFRYPWQIFQLNDWAIREDFELITRGRKSQPIHASNRCTAEENIFIEEGARVEHSILNAAAGPIYIGANATIMEGNLVRGPFSLGEGSTLKMGSKVYGATSIGPYCVMGGEIKNSVIFGYSNKAHDGYLGDSVIGEWCNLGAGTSNSNVKNTASDVKYILGEDQAGISAGIKGGLLMGDYSRAAINTSFNTGTVVGVCCNIFGNQVPGKYIANFSWGTERYGFEKAIRDIGNWKKMKGHDITEQEKKHLYQLYTSNKP